MKKLFAAITVVACVFFSSSSMAAGVKVPKLLCLEYDGINFYQQLTLKAIGTVYISGEKVKTYTVNGIDAFGRTLTGTAYVPPGGTLLLASYSTVYQNGWTHACDGGYELTFDLSTGTGTTDGRYHIEELGFIYDDDLPVSTIDCLTASTLAAPETTKLGMAASAGVR